MKQFRLLFLQIALDLYNICIVPFHKYEESSFNRNYLCIRAKKTQTFQVLKSTMLSNTQIVSLKKKIKM